MSLKDSYKEELEKSGSYRKRIHAEYERSHKTMLKIASEMGISPITLHKFLEGKIVQVYTLLKIKRWLEGLHGDTQL